MMDQFATIQLAAASLKTVAPQEILELTNTNGVSIIVTEDLEGLESQPLFLDYLLHHYSLPAAGAGNGIKQQLPAGVPPSLSHISERMGITSEGQELPSSGNRFPVVEFVGVDPKSFSLPKSLALQLPPAVEATVYSYIDVSKWGAGVVHTPDHVVDLQLGSARVENPLSSRIVWMVNENVQSANVRVNPPQLGPVEVRISVEGDQTNVSLIAQHSVVREIIESAIPRLRDMLMESGLNLVNIDVSQQNLSHRRQEDSPSLSSGQENKDSTDGSSSTNAELDNIQLSNARLGLIDYYV